MSQMCPACSSDNLDDAPACVSCGKPLLSLPGTQTVLVARYQVVRVLGCGGMGAINLADDGNRRMLAQRRRQMARLHRLGSGQASAAGAS